MLQKIVTDFGKVLDRVLPIHLFKDIVMASLYGNMDEGKDSGMVQKMGNSPQMFQHVRWIRHTNSHHNLLMVLKFFTQ